MMKEQMKVSGNTEMSNFAKMTSIDGYTQEYTTESYLSRARYNFAERYFVRPDQSPGTAPSARPPRVTSARRLLRPHGAPAAHSGVRWPRAARRRSRNMPSTPEAIAYFTANGGTLGPAKSANAGGVAVSALEMSQNSMRYNWTSEEVDEKLHNIMKSIFNNSVAAAEKYGLGFDLIKGANIAGFEKVVEAMISQGIY